MDKNEAAVSRMDVHRECDWALQCLAQCGETMVREGREDLRVVLLKASDMIKAAMVAPEGKTEKWAEPAAQLADPSDPVHAKAYQLYREMRR